MGKRCLYKCLAVCMAILLFAEAVTGCSQQGDEGSASGSTQNDHTVVWTMYDWEYDMSQHVDALNAKLKEDGYSFSVRIQTISCEESDDYREKLEEVMDAGETDIAYLGSYSSGSNSIAADMIRQGYFMELSEYLDSSDGAALKDAFYEERWESVRVDGGIYCIPNQFAMTGTQFFVFNRKYFSEEVLEGFDGSMESFQVLEDLMEQAGVQDAKYPFVCNISMETIAQMGGYEFRDGVFVSVATGETFNPYETEELTEYLYAMQSLYQNGYIALYNADTEKMERVFSNMDFGVCVMEGPNQLTEENQEEIICIQIPFSVRSLVTAGTGICVNAEHQEEALALLTLLYTDEEYANLLVLGEEGTDYYLSDDGYAYTRSGGKPTVVAPELLTGLYDLIYPVDGDLFPTERADTRLSLYDTEAKMDSVILGFQEEYGEIAALEYELNELVSQSATLWRKKDLETAINNASENFTAAGGDQVVEELGKQIEEWLD